jgi:hypothetical protein
MRMGLGVMTTQMLSAVAQLDIADKLAAGPKTAEDLAKESGAQPHMLYRVLRTLSSLGVFEELPGRKFQLTEISQLLRTGVPVSLRDMVVFFASAWSSNGCQHLLDAMKSGKSGIEEAFGINVFQYLGGHPGDLTVFQGAMTGFSSVQSPAAVEAYDFSPFKRIIDVAGGHGALLAHILRAAPQATGVVFELPEVAADGPEHAKSHGLADRMEFIAGDMFESVPPGGDLYVLKYIVHDWGDESAKKFLTNIRKNIKPEGKLIAIDAVIAPGPHIGKIFDAYMEVLMPGGVERTEEEFAALYASCGFKLTRVIPTGSYLSIIEGVPV